MGKRKRLMAESLKEAKKVTAVAKLNDVPTSPRKMRLVADTVRGKEVNHALDLLKFSKREARLTITVPRGPTASVLLWCPGLWGRGTKTSRWLMALCDDGCPTTVGGLGSLLFLPPPIGGSGAGVSAHPVLGSV